MLTQSNRGQLHYCDWCIYITKVHQFTSFYHLFGYCPAWRWNQHTKIQKTGDGHFRLIIWGLVEFECFFKGEGICPLIFKVVENTLVLNL
ncbi:Uncharacterized protein TCM_026852 [Theobroma cacao]|uniref:Uncharacterized protein n=1 Tax=Theobroma cacao TaxID=3641 RepID=A0A061FBC9_THECC|nr:Uncharacterized protein TCM_026852 [Theobroma cacao]